MQVPIGESPYEQHDMIELHPCTDQWVQGDKFGVVTRVGKFKYYVHMNMSGRMYAVPHVNILRHVGDAVGLH